jgi:hypothetical protein
MHYTVFILSSIVAGMSLAFQYVWCIEQFNTWTRYNQHIASKMGLLNHMWLAFYSYRGSIKEVSPTLAQIWHSVFSLSLLVSSIFLTSSPSDAMTSVWTVSIYTAVSTDSVS